MNWVIEEYDDYVKDLADEAKNQGHNVDFVRYYDMIKDPSYMGVGLPENTGSKFDPDQPTLFYGSIQTAQWIFQHRPNWVPGVWYNFNKYKVSSWANEFELDLLNADFIILPKGVIKRRSETLFTSLGEDDCIFMRPDSGTKAFGGRLFMRETFNKDFDNATHLMEDHELIVIASPNTITAEYRFVIAGDEVISGSQYKRNGSAEISCDVNSAALLKAQQLAKNHAKFNPDPMYTLDIGIHNYHCYVIEINNFCCSGLYACDLRKIVAKASALAVAEYKDLFQ